MRDSTPAEVTLRLQMGCAPAEFHQRLPAVAHVEYDAARMQFDHVEDGRRWSLRLIDPRQRTIGALHLPVIDVELVFQGYPQADIDSFMARFSRIFVAAVADTGSDQRVVGQKSDHVARGDRRDGFGQFHQTVGRGQR